MKLSKSGRFCFEKSSQIGITTTNRIQEQIKEIREKIEQI
jgi:hypothetical protein